jgi:predicted PurR-regulated permease PerM
MSIPAHTTLEGSAREKRSNLVRATLGIGAIVGLAAAALWIMTPFIPPLVWATMIVVATWPLMLRLQARVAHKRWVAVTVITAAFVLPFVIPSSVALIKIADSAHHKVISMALQYRWFDK